MLYQRIFFKPLYSTLYTSRGNKQTGLIIATLIPEVSNFPNNFPHKLILSTHPQQRSFSILKNLVISLFSLSYPPFRIIIISV